MENELTTNELIRYARQIKIDGWGIEKQMKLKQATVFVAGAGGLGSPVAYYLAAAGVGNIKICDFDVVDSSNLNRQIIHGSDRIGQKKVLSAKKTLEWINPEVDISAIQKKIDKDSISDMMNKVDIILDCLDNLETRLILNQYAVEKKIPLIYGGIWGLEGRMTFIQTPETPCLNCLFTESFDTGKFPVLGATPGVIGTLQAMETIKYLAEIGNNMKNKLLIWDGFTNNFNTVNLYKNPCCKVCNKD